MQVPDEQKELEVGRNTLSRVLFFLSFFPSAITSFVFSTLILKGTQLIELVDCALPFRDVKQKSFLPRTKVLFPLF